MIQYSFPKDFIWGAATAAPQIEGTSKTDGKGDSIWDVFCRNHPERIYQQETPQTACDHYHRYKEDVQLMHEIGLNGYRMSISWPRLFPNGTGEINQKGVEFYHNLFDELLAKGIEPNVTLYHWDLPNTLAENGGWLNPVTIDAFVEYAKKCFELFGKKVHLWATINEPAWTTLNSYITALHPPCHHNYQEAITVSYHFLLAHIKTVREFHTNYQGQIGFVMNMSTIYPATNSEQDSKAAYLADGILNRWFIEPVILGTFPQDIVDFYRKHNLLPCWSEDELQLFKDYKMDFVGVNYYYPHYASADSDETKFHINNSGNQQESCEFSIKGLFKFVKNPAGKYTQWAWEIYPKGIYELLKRAYDYDPHMPVYITENGIGCIETLNDNNMIDDQERIDFVKEHLIWIHKAITDGVNVKGYYMWSLMDNFSWINGFKKRYGFLYIDRTNNLQRYKKKSAFWYKNISDNNGF